MYGVFIALVGACQFLAISVVPHGSVLRPQRPFRTGVAEEADVVPAAAQGTVPAEAATRGRDSSIATEAELYLSLIHI